MKRRLFNFLSLASLALLLAVVAIWVRSDQAYDAASLVRRFGDPDVPGHGYTTNAITWSLGTMTVGSGTVLDRLPPDDKVFSWSTVPTARLLRRDSPWLRFSASFSSKPEHPQGWSRGTIVRDWRVTVPCWAVALIAAILPARWVVAHRTARRAARRAARGQCPSCGYDLRESPERCPECGVRSVGAPAGAAAPV